jgi:23S rRNA G2069 N7-methylase RlmK/C1962 C5-methylase RlmI
MNRTKSNRSVPETTLPGVRINRRAADRVRAGHLWVYASDIESVEVPAGEPPALLPVADSRGLLLGTALYSPTSQIALRIVSRSSLDEAAWLPLLEARLRAAIRRRRSLLDEQTNACRLCFSEADELPGLVADKYGDLVILQLLVKGLDSAAVRESCVRVLREELAPAAILERPDPKVRELEGLAAPSPEPLFIKDAFSEKHTSGAEQAVGKGRESGKKPEGQIAGAKAQDLLNGTCGTTEVVPCYKSGSLSGTFAASKAQVLFDGASGTTEVVPCYKTRPLSNTSADRQASRTQFRLNGLVFEYDANSGQKTGAFLDQRANYAAAAEWARRLGLASRDGGGRALDVCCYQGGFALHLAQVCAQVTGIDASRASLEVAERNLLANRSRLAAQVDWVEGDAFQILRDWSEAGESFDAIVLDPPAFAKSLRAVEGALRGYKELNLRALKMMRPCGLLITCSCSHHVSWSELEASVASAAADARRRARLLERRGAALDHPVALNLPETEYLKCLVLEVE